MKHKTVYINIKSHYGVETVDEFTEGEDGTGKDFRAYVREMVENYREAGCNVYISSRPCKEWKIR